MGCGKGLGVNLIFIYEYKRGEEIKLLKRQRQLTANNPLHILSTCTYIEHYSHTLMIGY